MTKGTHKRLPITVVVLNRNESRHLTSLLPTLTDWARVLVMDDCSTDTSKKVSESLGAKVITRKLNGDYAGQRNAALAQCNTTWVLFVDADERVSDELQAEIRQVILQKKNQSDGYYLSRNDVFIGKRLRYGETGSVKLLRLGKRKAGKWIRPVHEVWQIEKTGYLSKPLWHHSHISVKGMLAKIRRYAALEGRFRAGTGRRFSLFETIAYPLGKFGQNFMVRKGFKDGYPGLMMAWGMSLHSFLVRVNLWKHLYAPANQVTLGDKLWLWQVPLVLLLMAGGQLTRIPVWGTSIYVFEVIMALAVGVAMGVWLEQKRTLEGHTLWIALGGVIAVLALSLGFNYDFLGTYFWQASLYWWRYVLYAAWGFWLYQFTVSKHWRFPWRRMLIYWGSGLLLMGWLQYLLIPDMRWLYDFGFDDHLNRMVGSLFDPSFLGLMLLLTVIATIEEYSLRKPYLLIALLAGLLLTYARSIYALLVLAISVIAVERKKMGWLIIFLAVFGVGIWLLPRGGGEGVNLLRRYSVHSRAFSTLTAWEWFRERPVLGMGFNGYKWVAGIETFDRSIPSLPSGPDNSWVLVLATAGMVGGMSVLIYLSVLLTYFWKMPWLRLSLIIIVLHSMTNNSWFYPWVMVWVYLMIAERRMNTRVETKP
jgi:glycosyltransferase involved in cell wall biosynthesis